jgi:hypothetical protein
LLAAASGDDLWVEGGVYHESINLKSGVDLFGGFSGSEGEDDFAFRDWRANETIIDATGLNDSVVKGTSVESVQFDGFVVTGGRASRGGGMNLTSSYLAIRNGRIERNLGISPGDNIGGGCYAEESYITFEGVEIHHNTAFTGGGIRQEGGQLLFRKSHIHSNGKAVGVLSQGGAAETLSGGGIYIRGGGSLWLKECAVRDNLSRSDGGGIYVGASTAEIRDSTISGNTCRNGRGAGIYSSVSPIKIYDSVISGNRTIPSLFTGSGGGIHLGGESLIENSLISSNVGNIGGGIRLDYGNTAIIDCTIEYNQAEEGGGINVVNRYDEATISRCVIRNNTAEVGGGIHNRNPLLEIEKSEIQNNVATSYLGLGGGVALFGSAKISKCLIANNHSDKQGGGLWEDTLGATFENCLIVGNSATLQGGGGYFRSPGTHSFFQNCTFANNRAARGWGVYSNTAKPTFENCILVNSPTSEIVLTNDPDYVAFFGSEGLVTVKDSNISGGWPGEGNIDEDPLFLDAENGDYRLQPGSRCVDSASIEGPIDDLDGNPRPRDVGGIGRDGLNAFDMGAYEVQTPFANSRTDVNGDGRVDAIDLLMWMGDWMKEAD